MSPVSPLFAFHFPFVPIPISECLTVVHVVFFLWSMQWAPAEDLKNVIVTPPIKFGLERYARQELGQMSPAFKAFGEYLQGVRVQLGSTAFTDL